MLPDPKRPIVKPMVARINSQVRKYEKSNLKHTETKEKIILPTVNGNMSVCLSVCFLYMHAVPSVCMHVLRDKLHVHVCRKYKCFLLIFMTGSLAKFTQTDKYFKRDKR